MLTPGERELGVPRHREQRVQGARLGMGLVLEKSAVGRLDGIAQDAFGLLGVEDRKRAREADRFAVHAKGAMADAVKRAAPETARLEAGELVHAVEHFLGGLVGGTGRRGHVRTLDSHLTALPLSLIIAALCR